jgi:hypothetical protein
MSGSAIPAGQIVNVVPSVLNAGGVGLDLLGLLITTDNHIPLGEVYSFPNLTAVQTFFGPTSYIAALAGTYFLADINATRRPGALLMACYGSTWLPAWLRSAQLPTLTLAQLQACTPNSTITLPIDGVSHTSQPITLAAATSFSMAAQMIGAALGYLGLPINNTPNPIAVGSIAGNILTITAGMPGSPILSPMIVTGPGVPAGTYITANLSSTDNFVSHSTYQINRSLSIPAGTQFKIYGNPCSWDAQTFQFMITSAPFWVTATPHMPSIGYPTASAGNLAGVLKLNQDTGARLQPVGMNQNPAFGLAAPTPASFMDGVLKKTMNWASFMTAFDPDQPGQNTQKQAFAAWTNLQQSNYLYVAWDNDVAPTVSASAPNSLASILHTSLSSGTAVIYSPNVSNGRNLAAFTMGVIAAIDFNRLNGRKTLAFRGQTGIIPDITDGGVAANLEANFYNYYGIWTTANDQFRFLYPGVVSGPYKWIDSFINQIWMNNGFQQALMELLTQTGSIPYTQVGYTMIKAACQDVINAALNFGAIRAGVTLSEAQINAVNNMAGVPIDGILNSIGYYLQVLDAAPQVRGNRGTPPCTFWYADGGSVQRITLASVMVQ